MSLNWIIRLSQDKKPANPFLINITSKHEDGLDLDLLATDGDIAFKGKVRQRHLTKLKAKNYDGSDSEFSDVIQYFLRPEIEFNIDATQKQNLDIGCSVTGKDPKATLTITIRNKIEDITQRIASIELPQTSDTDDVDLFGWTCGVIEQRDTLRAQAAKDTQDAESSKHTISKLEEQLNELVQAKQEHETQVLTKCALLLNEKKLKIRNLQRVLASVQVDPDKLAELQATIKSEPVEDSSSRNKRSADEMSVDEEGYINKDGDEMDVDDDIDVDEEPDSDVESRQTTPRNSDDERDDDRTESESESEGEASAAQTRDPSKSGSKLRKPQSSPVAARKNRPPSPKELLVQKKSASTTSNAKAMVTESSKDSKTGGNAAPSTPLDDEETASEDDEL